MSYKNCRLCGTKSEDGVEFDRWVKPTFTNFDKLYQGEIICNSCLFWFNEQDADLAKKVGKEKPQRMRTYSHFIKNGVWTPYLKDKKFEMFEQLTVFPFPELAVISDFGQKHLVFRAKRNKCGGQNGWVQFEEMSFYLIVDEFLKTYQLVNELYQYFNKEEISIGIYNNYNQLELLGIEKFVQLEIVMKGLRRSNLFQLCLFFVKKDEKIQRELNGKREARKNSKISNSNLAVNKYRLQKEVCVNDMETVRRKYKGVVDDKQSEEVYQFTLF